MRWQYFQFNARGKFTYNCLLFSQKCTTTVHGTYLMIWHLWYYHSYIISPSIILSFNHAVVNKWRNKTCCSHKKCTPLT
jgi:hypothetical protein